MKNFFENDLFKDLVRESLNYLDTSNLKQVALVNKRFNLLAKDVVLSKIALSVADLITQCYVTEIEEQLYLSWKDLFYEVEKTGQFYLKMITNVIKPFKGEQVVDSLFQKKFKVDYQGGFGQTVLHFFIDDIAAVKLLTNHKEVNIHAQDYFGNTALHYGIARASAEKAVQLMQIFSEKKFDFKLLNVDKISVIDRVFGKINKLNQNDPNFLPLLLSVPFDDLLDYLSDKLVTSGDVFKKLLQAKPEYSKAITKIYELNKANKAAINNEKDNKYNISVENIMRTLGNIPKEQHFSTMAGWMFDFLKYGYSQITSVDLADFYLIIKKILNFSHKEMAAMLLQNCEVNKPLFGIRTLLHFFVVGGDFESILFLLEKGADVNKQEIHKNTSLHLALQCVDVTDRSDVSRFFKIVNLFEEKNFKFNLLNYHKFTVCEQLLNLCNKVPLFDELRALLLKLLIVTYVNPTDALTHYQISDEKLNDELRVLLQTQMHSEDLVLFSEPQNSKGSGNNNDVFQLLKDELLEEEALKLSKTINLEQAIKLVSFYREFPICLNLNCIEGFNEFLLSQEYSIVKKIDEYEQKNNYVFTVQSFKLLALLFKKIDNDTNGSIIFETVLAKFGSFKCIDQSNFNISTMRLIIRDWNKPWFRILTIDQIKLIDEETLISLAQLETIKQIMIVEEMRKRFEQNQMPAKIDLNYLLTMSLEFTATGAGKPDTEEDELSLINNNSINHQPNQQMITTNTIIKNNLQIMSPEERLSTLIDELSSYFKYGPPKGMNNLMHLSTEFSNMKLHVPCRDIAGMVLKKCPKNQPMYKDGSLLHFFIINGDFDSVVFLIEQGEDVNKQDILKRTPIHALIEKIDVTKNSDYAEKFLKLVELFEEKGFNFSLRNAAGFTVCELLIRKLEKKVFTDELRRLVCKLMVATYLNPVDLLKDSNITDEKFNNEICAFLQNQKLSENMFLFTPAQSSTVPNGISKKKGMPSDPYSKQVYAGMQLQLKSEDLNLLPFEEQLTICAYRVIGLITHPQVIDDDEDHDEFIESHSGKKYFYDDEQFIDFYYEEMKHVIDKLPPSKIVMKIIELGFDINKTGDHGESISTLHLFAIFNKADALELLLAQGAVVDVGDSEDETPLHKLVLMLNSPTYRKYVTFSALKCLIDAGADLKFTIEKKSIREYLLEDFFRYEENSDEIISCIALLLTYSEEDPISILDNYVHLEGVKEEIEKLTDKILLFVHEKLAKSEQIGIKHQLSKLESDNAVAKKAKLNDDDSEQRFSLKL